MFKKSVAAVLCLALSFPFPIFAEENRQEVDEDETSTATMPEDYNAETPPDNEPIASDTIRIQEEIIPTTLPADSIAADTIPAGFDRRLEFNPDPTRAVWMSALCPGLGQIYNRRYWKVPIVIGGYVGLAYATSWNNRMLSDYTKAYKDIMDNDPDTKSYMDFYPSTTKEEDLDMAWLQRALKSKKDFYRRNRDLCIIGMVGLYLVCMVDAYVDLLRKTNEDVSALIEEGVATQADGLSVKVKLNEAEMAQTQVDNGLALSRMLLAQICGLPMDEPLRLADEALDDFPLPAKDEVAVDVNEAFLNRNELQALDLASKIYKKKERIVLADLLPSVAFSANYLVTNPSVFNGFKNDFGGMFNVGVIVRVPITAWWEGSYKRNAARAETRIKQLEWEDAREKIELQVNQSVYKVNETGKKLAASTRNMESAEENLRCANVGFEEGVIPTLNLMEAQTAWMSARSALIDAQIEMRLTRVYLNKALGKDLQTK